MRHTSLFHQMASKFDQGRVLLSVLTVGMLLWSSMPNISFRDIAYMHCSPKHIDLAQVLMRADYFNENKKSTAVVAVRVPLLWWLFHARKCLETTCLYGFSLVSSCCLRFAQPALLAGSWKLPERAVEAEDLSTFGPGSYRRNDRSSLALAFPPSLQTKQYSQTSSWAKWINSLMFSRTWRVKYCCDHCGVQREKNNLLLHQTDSWLEHRSTASSVNWITNPEMPPAFKT